MTNILYIIFGLNPGGTENQLIELVNRMDPDRFRSHVLHFRGITKRAVPLRSATAWEIDFPGFRSIKVLRTLKELREYARSQRIDVIQSFFETENLLASYLSFSQGIRNVISVRSLLPGLSSLSRRIQGGLFRRSSVLLANSEAVKRRVQEISGVTGEKIRVFPNGVDLDRFPFGNGGGDAKAKAKSELGLETSDFVVGMVANYREVKNHACLLRALRIVSGRKGNFKAVLVGWGPLRDEIARMCDEFHIGDRVRLAGGVDDPLPYLRAFDLVVLTSSHEGFPNAILEYMAVGLPVISTAVGGSCEVVADGVTGYLVDNNDHEALADRILSLIGDRARAASLGIAGRRRVEDGFSMDRMVHRHEELYESLSRRSA